MNEKPRHSGAGRDAARAALPTHPDPPPGQVLTPLPWAKRLVDGALFDKWCAGSSVFDPTGGAGHILEAFIALALERGMEVRPSMLERLTMMELDHALIEAWYRRARDRYGLAVPARSVVEGDFLLDSLPAPVDLLAGNPPWGSFPDLPRDYRDRLKPLFVRYGLTADSRSLLWGNSRVDLSALVLVRAFSEMLARGSGGRYGAGNSESARDAAGHQEAGVEGIGEVCAMRPVGDMRAAFFLPAGIFNEDGAHGPFMRRLADRDDVEVPELQKFTELTAERIFPSVSTRYGAACFGASCESRTRRKDAGLRPCHISPESRPRQGVNTCGANDLFMFRSHGKPDIEPGLLYPLIDTPLFRGWEVSDSIGELGSPGDDPQHPGQAEETPPHRWILLTYDPATGRPLSQECLSREYPRAWEYLWAHRERLKGRRGTVMGSMIQRGVWWGLLGVGPYTFARYKLVWPAYGARTFTPRLFVGRWTPNQALQCSMSFSERAEALRVQQFLLRPQVEEALHEAGGAGTPGWAQPGRMRRFFLW